MIGHGDGVKSAYSVEAIDLLFETLNHQPTLYLLCWCDEPVINRERLVVQDELTDTLSGVE